MADPKDPKSSNTSIDLENILLENKIEKLERITKQIQQQEEESLKLNDIVQKGGDDLKNHLDFTAKMIEIEKDRVENLRKQLELEKELTDMSEEEYQTRLKELQTFKDQNEQYERRNNLENEFAKSTSNSFSNITGIGAQSKSFLGSMIKLSGESSSLSEAFKASYTNIKNIVTVGNVLAAVVDGIVGQTKKLFFEMDEAFSQFEKTAGGVDAFKGRIEELRSSNVEYALSIGDAAKAYSDLKVGFAGFAGVSKTTQDQLAQTTATMSKLGVSSTETIKIQNMLVKGFQMTGQQAGDLQRQLMATAKSMGLPMQKVVGDFANASNGMRAHGSNMQKVFLDLQNQSKNLGIEFSKLQKITGQFDTFEGAADSAGKLNAILGGDYLNSLDLLNADEGERIRLMQEALQASNKSFDAMSKQERMAAAQALGLEDATELQQLMNNEVEQGTVEALNKAQAEKELAQSVQDVTTMQEKLTAIMAQFAIVMIPVLDAIKSILTQIAEWMNKSEGFRNVIFGLIGVFAALFIVLKGASIIGGIIGGFRNLKETITGTKKPIEDAGSGFANAVEKVGKAAAGSAKGLLAFGAAILMIGGGILLAALGLAQLVMAFSGLGDAAWPAAAAVVGFTLAFGLMMIGLLALVSGPQAALTAAAIGVMLAIGAAALMIGGGMGVAAAGIGFMVGKVSELVKSITELFNALSKADPANIVKSFDALFDSISVARIGKFAAFAKAADGVADSIAGINNNLAEMIAKMSIVSAMNFIAGSTAEPAKATTPNVKSSTSISPINIGATPSIAATAASSTNTAGSSSQTNLIPVAIYIDSKKVGEILDPRVKQTIQDSLKKINSRMVPV
jgi:hypothetical protein